MNVWLEQISFIVIITRLLRRRRKTSSNWKHGRLHWEDLISSSPDHHQTVRPYHEDGKSHSIDGPERWSKKTPTDNFLISSSFYWTHPHPGQISNDITAILILIIIMGFIIMAILKMTKLLHNQRFEVKKITQKMC